MERVGYKYKCLCIHMHTDVGCIVHPYTLGVHICVYRQNSDPFSRFGVTKRFSAHNSEHPHICKDLMSDSAWL